MTTEPQALRLADALELCWGDKRIDEAAAELRRLHKVEEAFNVWLEKTEWVQDTAQPRELGMHRADILRRRIDKLRAENEALREANNSLATASILPDDKMIVSRADYAELMEALQSVVAWMDAPDESAFSDTQLAAVRAALAKVEASNGL